MRKDPSQLKARKLSEQEVQSLDSAGKKILVMEWLKKQFIDPETNVHICVGQGIEIGPFDSENEGRNWVKYYLPDTYKAMGWGKSKTANGHARSPISSEVRNRDGRFYMWLLRVTE